MQNKKCLERCLELIRDKRYRELSAILAEQNPVDLADLLEGLPQEQGALAFRTLPKEQAAEVFSNLPPDTQQMIVVSLPDRELAGILEELAMDDTVDLLEELPAGVVKRVLKNARPETRRLINQFLKYPEQSVGSIMTAEFIDLKGTMTAAEAIRRIRRLGGDCESIYTCYVTDGRRVLDGVVTLRELLLAPDNAPVRTLMEPNVITVRTTDDQELAVRALMRYDFLSLPVVDQEDRLVGVVTVDDVMDVMEEEATEDFQRMAAMAPSEKSYLKTGVFALAKNRILWLLVLMISGMITGGILGRYEAAFSAVSYTHLDVYKRQDQPPVHLALDRDAVVLELQIVAIRAEQFPHLQGNLFGLVIVPCSQQLGHLAPQAGGAGDQAAAVLPQQVQVDAGLDVKALQERLRDHVGEIAVALLIPAQQDQVVEGGVELVDLLEPGPAPWGHIDLTADDGLDARLLACLVEIHHPVHDPVVCDSHRVLSDLPDPLHQLLDAAGAIQKGEFRMQM